MRDVPRTGARRVHGSLAAACCAALLACTTQSTTAILNPIAHGTLAAIDVRVTESGRGPYLGLPENTFTHTARITLWDREQICFGVVIVTDGARPFLAGLDAWRVMLRADRDYENDSPILAAPVVPTAVSAEGSIARQVTDIGIGCTNGPNGESCTPSGGGTTVRTPAMITVITGGGSVCFAHGGRLGAQTRRVMLLLHDLRLSVHRLEFRWDLVP